MYFLVNLRRGCTPPLCRSTRILKELFDSTQRSGSRIDPEIALNQGGIAFKSTVDLHPCSFMSDYGFYSLVNTPNRLAGWPTLSPGFGEAWGVRVDSPLRLRVVKERPSLRLGGLVTQSIVSYFVRQYKHKLRVAVNKPRAGCTRPRRRPPRIYLTYCAK